MALPRWASCFGALLLAIVVSHPAVAQALASPPSEASMTASAPGNSLAPTLVATRLGFSLDQPQPRAVNVSAATMSRHEGRAFALVGAAAVIAGILIGDDAGTVIAIGGAGLGLYGLYIWQR